MLTADELRRYSRQIVLPELGVEGQERLSAAKVIVVGAGGLGSPVALYLAAAGVGHIGLVDHDVVDVSNLHRQILHSTGGVGASKTASAAASIRELNPHVRVERFDERLTLDRARTLFPGFDLVIDGSDNYPARYAINDACAALQTPWVYGSVERFAGQVSVFSWGDGPCYRCVFPHPPEPGSTQSCEEIGVLGAVPGVIGSLQAVEAMKCLLKIGEPMAGRLLQIDFLRWTTSVIRVKRRPDCAACGAKRVDRSPAKSDAPAARENIQPAELAAERGGVLLLDVRERWEWNVSRIEGAVLIPMSELESRVESIDRSRPIVVYCHHGVRSVTAAAWMRELGMDASSLVGGIDRWSREIDSSVPRY